MFHMVLCEKNYMSRKDDSEVVYYCLMAIDFVCFIGIFFKCRGFWFCFSSYPMFLKLIIDLIIINVSKHNNCQTLPAQHQSPATPRTHTHHRPGRQTATACRRIRHQPPRRGHSQATCRRLPPLRHRGQHPHHPAAQEVSSQGPAAPTATRALTPRALADCWLDGTGGKCQTPRGKGWDFETPLKPGIVFLVKNSKKK